MNILLNRKWAKHGDCISIIDMENRSNGYLQLAQRKEHFEDFPNKKWVGPMLTFLHLSGI